MIIRVVLKRRMLMWFAVVLLMVSGASALASGLLRQSPSVRSMGMGLVGVMLTDANAFYCNPAALGFLDAQYGSVSFGPQIAYPSHLDPTRDYPDIDYVGAEDIGGISLWVIDRHRSYVLTVSLYEYLMNDDSPLGAGFSYSLLSIHPRSLSVYQGTRRADTDQVDDQLVYGATDYSGLPWVSDKLHQFALGASYRGAVDIGVGAGWKHLAASAGSLNLFDFGVIARIRLYGDRATGDNDDVPSWRLGAAVGVSFANYGDVGLLEDSRIGRFGLSLELTQASDGIKHISIVPAGELEVRFAGDNEVVPKIGVEFGGYELVYVRGGLRSEPPRVTPPTEFFMEDFLIPSEPVVRLPDKRYTVNSVGVSLSSVGLRKLLGGDRSGDDKDLTFWKFLRRNLNIELSYAREWPSGSSISANSWAVRVSL